MSHRQKHDLSGNEHEISSLAEGTVQIQNVSGVKSLVTTPFSWHGGRYVGEIIAWPTTTPPAGCLLCDGSAVSRAEYSDLFAVIGTTFGVGDGTTTFNLPDYRGRFLEGTPTDGTVGEAIEAGLPEITGTVGVSSSRMFSLINGAFQGTAVTSNSYVQFSSTTNGTQYPNAKLKASGSSSIYGNSDTVQPPASCVNFVIVAATKAGTPLPFSIYSGMPIGAIFQFAATISLPAGLLVCDGAAISRADYAALFERLGTLYGAGDGSTTFNLPDFRGKFAEGTPSGGIVGTSVEAGLPNIMGTVTFVNDVLSPGTNTIISDSSEQMSSGTSYASNTTTQSRFRAYQKTIDASKVNSIYGSSTTVQPPAIHVQYVIIAL